MADDIDHDVDYYAVLRVPPDADEVAIRIAYRRLARRFHPDVTGEAGAAQMKQLNAAYQVLADPEQRRRYDLQRGIDRAAPVRNPPHPPHGAARDAPPRSTPPRPAPPPPPHPARPATPPRSTAPRRGVIGQRAGPLRALATLEAPDATPVVALAFAPGGLIAGLGLLDGRVLLHDLRAGQSRPLTSFPAQAAGALQELRLSPSGAYAATWGFPLGTHVFRTADGATLWRTATDAPAGLMDAALLEQPGLPPLVRLAVPDAPLALAADDPFRWADEGKRGTAVYSRPLAGPVSPAQALPLRVSEAGREGGRSGASAKTPDQYWRVRQRTLSADGQRLFTVATGGAVRGERGVALSLYDLEARSQPGVPGGRSGVKRVARVAEPEAALTFPFAATADLTWAAASDFPVGLVLISLLDRMRRPLAVGAVRPDALLAVSPDAGRVAIARAAHLDLWDARDGWRVQEWDFAAEVTSICFAAGFGEPMLGVGLANGLAVLLG